MSERNLLNIDFSTKDNRKRRKAFPSLKYSESQVTKRRNKSLLSNTLKGNGYMFDKETNDIIRKQVKSDLKKKKVTPFAFKSIAGLHHAFDPKHRAQNYSLHKSNTYRAPLRENKSQEKLKAVKGEISIKRF